MITDISDITSFKWATVTTISPLGIKLDGDTATLAMVPDSLVDPNELIIGDRVRVELTLRKCIIHGAANDGAASGDVKATAATTAPRGWMIAQGQSLVRTAYPRLFAAIGTTYGAADSTHFTLPDMRGKSVVGYASTQTEFNTLGKTGGEKTHLLTTAEIPSHTHGIYPINYAVTPQGGGTTVGGTTLPQSLSQASGAAGGGGAHNNLQPYIALNYIIKI